MNLSVCVPDGDWAEVVEDGVPDRREHESDLQIVGDIYIDKCKYI